MYWEDFLTQHRPQLMCSNQPFAANTQLVSCKRAALRARTVERLADVANLVELVDAAAHLPINTGGAYGQSFVEGH